MPILPLTPAIYIPSSKMLVFLSRLMCVSYPHRGCNTATDSGSENDDLFNTCQTLPRVFQKSYPQWFNACNVLISNELGSFFKLMGI